MKLDSKRLIPYLIVIVPLILVLSVSFFMTTFYINKVKNYFEKENMMDVVREDARRKKALQDVISKVSIKEVDVESNENEEE